MKISIWQQFSSNHSNDFTVVGEFNSIDDAKSAAREFSTMLETIYNSRSKPYDYRDDATEEEIAIGHHYGINWDKHLEWAIGSDNVSRFDAYVMVDSIGETYRGALYIDRIMAKLADKTYVETEMGRDGICVELSCVASDKEKATDLFNILNPYFIEVREERGHLIKPPWRFISEKLFNFDEYHTSDDLYYGRIKQNKAQLIFTNLSFSIIGFGLPALKAYLANAGCIDIEYSLIQRPFDEIYEEDNS